MRYGPQHATDRCQTANLPMLIASPIPTIVFDLDGTLADTANDLVTTLNSILEREGLEAIPLASARDLIGQGTRALLQRGFALQGRSLAAARLEELFEEFLHLYGQHLVDQTTLFPGVEAALERLARRGHRLAVCTNKTEELSRDLLVALGVAPRFAAICGRDTFAFCKPDPRHLTETVRLAGGSAKTAIMVGDSKTDIDTARAAELPVIAVPFGYTDVPVTALAPDIVIAHFDEIDAAIAELSQRVLA
ncbi:phosphoglycolate phosphatase [Rhizobiales bacterium GAS191]|nr:phosphoglycolate phosphatase [Rhizobiales bacterium GAS191]SEE44504.1 phosphoglycolate phosphatase [Rhizobiales bacterium GAS188]